jgi:hypothetical protein
MHIQAYYKVMLKIKRHGFWWDALGLALLLKKEMLASSQRDAWRPLYRPNLTPPEFPTPSPCVFCLPYK